MSARTALRPLAWSLGTFLPAAALLVFVLGFTSLWYGFFDLSDISLYFALAARIDRGMRPFVDFGAEYPPLALRLFSLPGHPKTLDAYVVWFSLSMLLCLAAGSVLVTFAAARLHPGRRGQATAAITYAAAILALGAIVANRYDAAVALCLAAFLALLAGGRQAWASLALGLGAALKLTPALLLPLPLILAADRRTRALCAGAFLLAAGVPYLLEGTAAAQGFRAVLRYHAERPLQAESALATPLLLARLAGLLPVQIGNAYGSQFVDAAGAPLLARLSGPMALVLLAGTYALVFARRDPVRREPGSLALVTAAVLLAFLAPAKVLSPQFFVWLVPPLALLAPDSPGLAGLLLGVLLLTQVEFPALYWDFVGLAPGPVLLVAARNALLIGGLVAALVRLARLGRQRSAPPAASAAQART